MTVDLTNDDRGKTVVTDERIGVVTDAAGDRVSVDPDWSNVDDDLAATFGWSEDDEDHTFDTAAVTDVRNDQVYLRHDL